jgi:hypothetical protein
MGVPSFLDTLKREVGRMQALYPDREGELARAHALILHGMVVPSPDDPSTGQVLSSDAQTVYHVNSHCDCRAGEHGTMCKHRQAWALYLHIAKKVEVHGDSHTPAVSCHPNTPEVPGNPHGPLPEAPASVNVRVQVGGHEVQWTLRDHDEARLAQRLEALLARYPQPQPTPQVASQGQLSPQQHNAAAMHRPVTGFCPVHNVAMQEQHKNGRTWWSHRTADGWCKGR